MIKIVTIVNGPLQENCYLVINTENSLAVIIDGGGNISLIDQAVKNNGVIVTAMLLTHYHFDHASVAAPLQKRGIKIYISNTDAYGLSERSKMSEYLGYSYNPCKPDVTFDDGDIINEAGLSFKVILTPGHTAGSCCFLVENVLFSGDTLFMESIGRTDFPESVPHLMGASLKKLFSLEKDYVVYPGHGEQTSLFYEKQYNPFVFL